MGAATGFSRSSAGPNSQIINILKEADQQMYQDLAARRGPGEQSPQSEQPGIGRIIPS